jgi:hypothetical protein
MLYDRLMHAVRHGLGIVRDVVAPGVPLKLWNQPHWELRGSVDATQLLRSLSIFEPATTLYLEGTAIAKEIEEFLQLHVEAGPYLPGRQVIWSTDTIRRFRLPASRVVLDGLARMAKSYAEPELFEFLFLYRESEAIVEYPDAFHDDSPMYVSGHVPEERVHRFADELGLRVSREGV